MMANLSEIFHHTSRTPPATLFHYTSLEVLKEIVTPPKLWASNLRFLNDDSEYAFPLTLFMSRVDKFIAEYADDNEAQSKLHECKQELQRMLRFDAYICSFSGQRDDLSQWRGYCPPCLGVCIGFRTVALADSIGSMCNQKEIVRWAQFHILMRRSPRFRFIRKGHVGGRTSCRWCQEVNFSSNGVCGECDKLQTPSI
jgi:hypothetical protein